MWHTSFNIFLFWLNITRGKVIQVDRNKENSKILIRKSLFFFRVWGISCGRCSSDTNKLAIPLLKRWEWHLLNFNCYFFFLRVSLLCLMRSMISFNYAEHSNYMRERMLLPRWQHYLIMHIHIRAARVTFITMLFYEKWTFISTRIFDECILLQEKNIKG